MNANHAVADRQHGALVAQLGVQIGVADFAPNNFADFRGTQLLHFRFSVSGFFGNSGLGFSEWDSFRFRFLTRNGTRFRTRFRFLTRK